MDVSIEHTTVTLNGHEVTGLTDDAEAIMFPDIEIASVKRGATGKMMTNRTGNKGGKFSLKLLPNSESLPFFAQQFAQQLLGASITWNGSVVNHLTGQSSRLEKGVMVNGPSGQTLGKGEAKDQVFEFEFEKIVSNYDAVVN